MELRAAALCSAIPAEISIELVGGRANVWSRRGCIPHNGEARRKSVSEIRCKGSREDSENITWRRGLTGDTGCRDRWSRKKRNYKQFYLSSAVHTTSCPLTFAGHSFLPSLTELSARDRAEFDKWPLPIDGVSSTTSNFWKRSMLSHRLLHRIVFLTTKTDLSYHGNTPVQISNKFVKSLDNQILLIIQLSFNCVQLLY